MQIHENTMAIFVNLVTGAQIKNEQGFLQSL